MRPQLTNALSIDCEMVLGREGKTLLAQVALCNEFGQCVYNFFVKHPYVADYRTHITGVTPNHIRSGKQYQVVRSEVADLIRGRILVGHSMHHDLRALGLGHPEWNKRDTAYFFRTVEDARATMLIYKEFQEEWENHHQKVIPANIMMKQVVMTALMITK